MQDEAAQAVDPGEGIVFSGGQPLAAADETKAFYRRVSAILASFLQVKNLSVLLGAGPSYPLGSPQIRAMTADAILEMINEAGVEPTAKPAALIRHLVARGAGTIDLEHLLANLGAVLSLAEEAGEVEFAGIETCAETVIETRRLLNHALAKACDLPKQGTAIENVLIPHRTFFRRLLRSRRLDLPRVRVFTTNYDLVIEKALDRDGITYFDGFAGTVERVFRPQTLERDLFLPPDSDQRRMLRVPDVLYLHKLHGSINWRSRNGTATGVAEVIQAPVGQPTGAEDLAIIFPTPLKEGDVLAYPYSVMFRTFMSALSEPDSALLVIGYGFADDHINRQILQALGSPSFQLMAVAPSGVITTCSRAEEELLYEFADSPIGALAAVDDARITVLTGTVAGTFEDLAMRSMPDLNEAAVEVPPRTQESLAASLLKQS